MTFLPATLLAEKPAADPDAKRLEQLRQRINKLRQVLKKARTEKTQVQSDLQRMEKSIGRINRKLRQLRLEIGEQQKRLRELYQQQKTLRSSLSRQRAQLAGQVRASYVMGRQEQLKIVLNQGDPSTLQRALVYFDYLNRSRTEQIEQALARLQQLKQVEQEINKEKQKVEELLKRQSANREKLLETRTARKKILRALSRDIVSKDKQLVSMLQDEKELQRILRAVESLGDIPASDLEGKPFAQRKGRLPWPANGRIREKFGNIRAAGGLLWTGVLIDAKSGQDVQAIARGRVAFADWLRGYGLMVIIDHGDGYMSLYGHNQSLFKEIGEWVEEGETIATVGSSGGKARSQLYFELRHKGKPVNPARWCRRTHGGIISLKR
jgi:septal ring factor EnvC (AmiA/AmiB activator)